MILSDVEQRQARARVLRHDPRCDRDLCSTECPRRAWAIVNDYWYAGRK